MIIKTSDLHQEILRCKHCIKKLPFGPNPVVQIGEGASILIAGQAPGRKVHDTGIPFNDASGDRLRDWMGISADVFYDPNKVAILPMGFCYPGQGKSGDLPPLTECAELWREKALSSLKNIQLTLLVGSYAQTWHLQKQRKSNLTSTVKSWKEYWPKTLPLPHPSPRNNIWLKKNSWFNLEILPELQQRVDALLK